MNRAEAFDIVIGYGKRHSVQHVNLAMHASLSTVLTPDLINLLRINFVPHADWLAESDLLLSELCFQPHEQLYEIKSEIREFLKEQLIEDPEYGHKRTRDVYLFLHEFARRNLRNPDLHSIVIREALIALQWVALSEVDPSLAAATLASEMNKSIETGNQEGAIGVARLSSNLAESLFTEDKILLYASALEKHIQDDVAQAEDIYSLIADNKGMVNIHGIDLPDMATVASKVNFNKKGMSETQQINTDSPPVINTPLVNVPDRQTDYHLPETVYEFVHNILLNTEKNFVITGEPGIGKTLLANALCHDEMVQNKFSDGIYWINVSKINELKDIVATYLEIISIFSGEKKQTFDLNTALQYLMDLSERKSLLFVFNGLDEATDKIRKELIEQLYFVFESSSRLLITVRPPVEKSLINDYFVIYDIGKNLSYKSSFSEQKIFISYSRINTDFASLISQTLNNIGLNPVPLSSTLNYKKRWQDEVRNNIDESDAVLVIVTTESTDSKAVRSEISYARKSNKRIIPLLVSGDDSHLQHLNLSQLQYIDFRYDYNQGIDRLVKALSFYVEAEEDKQSVDNYWFLNYPRSYQPVAKQLTDTIRKDGISIWADNRLFGGQDWWDEIQRRIKECRGMVCLLSSDFIQSEYCMRELKLAKEFGKPVLSAIVDDVDVPKSLRRDRLVDARDNKFEELISRIKGMQVTPSAPERQPPAPAGKHYFISYSNADNEPGSEFALKLHDALEGGYPAFEAWLDKRDLQPDRDWDVQIDEGIRDCAALLFIMTPDSVRENSVCKLEWSRALNYKKPVVLLKLTDCITPFRLQNRQYIEFDDFDAGIAQLRQHLEWLKSPEGEWQRLKDEKLDVEWQMARAPEHEQPRLKKKRATLEQQIARQQYIIENPEAAQKQTQKSIDAAIERSRPAKNKPATTTKFINYPPATVPGYFQNRLDETRILADFLKNDRHRIMHLIGRAGIGKTAVTVRLLKTLESGKLPDDNGEMSVDGIVYLSVFGSRDIKVVNLYSDLLKLLPDDTADRLQSFYRDPQTDTADKMQALTAHFPLDTRVVVLLDSFEDMLDHDGRLTDSELEAALKALLDAPPHGLRVIITTRRLASDVYLHQPHRQRKYVIGQGLEKPFAEDMLRQMDDGTLGLKEASEKVLSEICDTVQRRPRALEAVVGLLEADAKLSVDELLEDVERLNFLIDQ